MPLAKWVDGDTAPTAKTTLNAAIDAIDALNVAPPDHAASHATGGGDALTAADIDAVPETRTLTAGTGLTGGGDLSANRTLSLDQTAALTLTALSPYASLRAILTTDQTGVASGDFYAVDWTNATRTLTGLAWDSGTATRLTVSTGYGGLYLLVGTLAWDADATGRRFPAIYVNGSLVMQSRPSFGLASVIPILQVVYLGALAAGDYVELRGYQDSGANRTYKAASSGAQVSLYGVRLFA